MVKIECDLDESLFIKVYPTDLFLFPMSMYCIISSYVLAAFIDKSFIKTPFYGVSLRSNLAFGSLLNKSLTSSL